MAFVVQTDEGDAAGANSYITVEELIAYHADRGFNWATYSTPQQQAACVKATDYLDTRFNYRGLPLTDEQTTQWPRECVFDKRGEEVDGIPLALKQSCCEYAMEALLQGDIYVTPDPEDNGRVVKEYEEKVGPITERKIYDTGAGYTLPEIPKADMRLRASGFLVGGYVRAVR